MAKFLFFLFFCTFAAAVPCDQISWKQEDWDHDQQIHYNGRTGHVNVSVISRGINWKYYLEVYSPTYRRWYTVALGNRTPRGQRVYLYTHIWHQRHTIVRFRIDTANGFENCPPDNAKF